jgi:hypothetical protein
MYFHHSALWSPLPVLGLSIYPVCLLHLQQAGAEMQFTHAKVTDGSLELGSSESSSGGLPIIFG